MTISRITNRVEQLGSAWEDFKKINDRRLNEIEKKGSADSLTNEQLRKINDALDGYKSRIDNIETVFSRPALGGDNDGVFMSQNQIEHKTAFRNYIRKGVEGDLAFLEKKALSVTNDADGGYLVTPQMSEALSKRIFEISPMRQLANVVTISTDTFEVIDDNSEAEAGWAASETAAVTDTDTPTIGKIIIPAYELVAQPKATQKLIDDSSIDIESWLSEKLVEVFSRKENEAFINGNAADRPKGILSYAAGTGVDEVEQVNSGVSGVVTADSLINLFYSLKDEYARNATFLMNRATAQAVRLLKEVTTGQYLWQPGLAAGAPDTLLGVPAMQAADMPTPAANALAIAVGDFKRAYQIVDRTGVRILRDPYTDKPFIKFYTTKRVGGAVVNTEALKLLKLAA